MSPHSRQGHSPFRPSLFLVLLIGFLGVLWVAGGASRADTWGQVVVRAVAWLILVGITLAGERPKLSSAKPVAWLLLATLSLVLLQLVPLPPAVWQALPGRTVLLPAIEGDQPWRPLAMVPGATVNAASSLVVPFATFLLLTGLPKRSHSSLPAILLGLVAASMLLGLLQFSGAQFLNPLLNATLGQVSGSFANRNHFALFLAMGCFLAPAWAFARRDGVWRRAPVALALVLLFMLTILATGSRAGLLLGVIALGGCVVFSWPSLRRELRSAPRWFLPALALGITAIAIALVVISVGADRANSIHRALIGNESEDMRSRGLPTVWAMVKTYFPAGSGFGGFDPLFRMHEPFSLLKLTYFNHAHNDFLEVALDGGLPAILLMTAALCWWLIASIRVWRAPWGESDMRGRLGSAMLTLVFTASAFDYPARTPMMMAMIVIAGVWLAKAGEVSPHVALPAGEQSL